MKRIGLLLQYHMVLRELFFNVMLGFESRTSAIRIITPPICSPAATRIEIRVPGADINCYLACAAITACGFYGIENNLELPPLLLSSQCEMLPRSLEAAVFAMSSKESLARKTLGDEFVDHYVATREHELRYCNSNYINIFTFTLDYGNWLSRIGN